MGAANEWFNVSITKEQIADAAFNPAGKSDFDAVNSLSQFLFGLGVSVAGGTEYYLDNIAFVLQSYCKIN